MSAAVRFDGVDVVHGARPEAALALLDAGVEPAEIKARTGQVVAVQAANLEIERGRITVVMGLSGSGKSTLLRAVNGLASVARGHVHVEDGRGGTVDAARIDPRTMRRLRQERIAMVFQAFALMPWRTVRDNVGLGLELRGMAASARAGIVAETLALVGLEAWADQCVHELSGGMQQRVGLARALATDAPILLMDEPFSALDPLIRGHLQNELLDIQARLQKTILFVSHDLDEAVKLGHRIAIMDAGRIVQSGAPAAIVRAPATPFVAEFVARANPLDLLTAAAVMSPAAASTARDRPIIPPDAPLRRIVELARSTGLPVHVVDDTGEVLGCVGDAELADGVFRALTGRPSAAHPAAPAPVRPSPGVLA